MSYIEAVVSGVVLVLLIASGVYRFYRFLSRDARARRTIDSLHPGSYYWIPTDERDNVYRYLRKVEEKEKREKDEAP